MYINEGDDALNTTHSQDSPERRHYTIDRKSFVSISPTLLYTGMLMKAQDWRSSSHSHDFIEILFILDGDGTVDIDENKFPIKKGDIVVYNAHSNHLEQSSNDEPLEAFFVAFDKIQLKNLPPNCILPERAKFIFSAGKYGDTITELFKTINSEIAEKGDFYVEIAKNTSIALLMFVFRILNQAQSSGIDLLSRDNILSTVLPFIEANFLKDISLANVATECFVNKYYLSHIFTENFGMSIGQYIHSKRIELSKPFLSAGTLSVADVAEKCGFNDTNYFGRIFKKSVGLTPLQYRNASLHKR